MPHKKNHIAVIRLSAMGDVAMTVPVILAFTRQYPDAKLTIVSRAFFRPIFQNLTNVRFHSAHTKHQHKGLLGIYTLYKELKKREITEVADLHNVLRSKVLRLLFSLSGIKTAYTDKGRAEKAKITRLENKEIVPLKPMYLRHVETFLSLGFPLDMSQPLFLEKRLLTGKTLFTTGEKEQPWLGIAPFAQHDGKVYPMDLMQQVIDTIAKNKGLKIFLLGGGSHESALLDKMKGTHDNVINIANKMSFEDELDLISNLDLMVSMDSGNAHLAAMFGVKTITLWGATHPYAGFSPYNQSIENCLTADREQYPFLPTSVYGNKKVAGYDDAMRTISVEQVVKKINSNLA